MPEIATLVNYGQTFMSSYPGSIEEDKVKTLCLYNDIVLLSLNKNWTTLYIEGLVKDYGIEKSKLEKTFISIDEITEDNSFWKSTFDYKINSQEILGTAFDEESSRLYMEEFANAKGLSLSEFEETLKDDRQMAYAYFKEIFYNKISAISSLLHYDKINSIIPCSLTGFSIPENFVLNSYIKYNTSPAISPKIDNISKSINSLIPSVDQLDWNEIFEIRGDHRIKSFREWLNHNSQDIQDIGMVEAINKELWAALGELKPGLAANSVKGVLGNLPLPIPINPMAIVTSLYDIGKNIQFNKKYNWLLFTYDLRNKVAKKTNAGTKKD
jgi:hypothetical protein